MNLLGRPPRPRSSQTSTTTPRASGSSIDYGNEVLTVRAYTYDPLTFRLTNLTTDRPGSRASRADRQDLAYTYDPVGNITHIQDDATSERSSSATSGRAERRLYLRRHLPADSGQRPRATRIERWVIHCRRRRLPTTMSRGSACLTPATATRWEHTPSNICTTASATSSALSHSGSNPANPGWTRTYTYKEASLLNRPSQQPPEQLERRRHSSGTNLHLRSARQHDDACRSCKSMQWDFKDHLLMTQRQAVNAADADGIAHQGEQTLLRLRRRRATRAQDTESAPRG